MTTRTERLERLAVALLERSEGDSSLAVNKAVRLAQTLDDRIQEALGEDQLVVLERKLESAISRGKELRQALNAMTEERNRWRTQAQQKGKR